MNRIPPWLRDRRLWLALTWALAVGVAVERFYGSRHAFDSRDADPDRCRADANSGHAEIDFGGQWVFARTLATGHHRQLYDRNRHWQIVRDGYPRSRTSEWVRRDSFPHPPGVAAYSDSDARHDADWLMYWFMGDHNDSPQWADVGSSVAATVAPTHPLEAVVLTAAAHDRVTPAVVEAVNRKSVGGPLYPPIHAFLYYPLGCFSDPQQAYFVFQCVCLGCGFLAGLGVRVMTNGAIPWPLATLVVLLYPGFREGVQLAQNPAITLCIIVWGWALVVRGRETWGGVVWGLLAFKPVWAAAFLLLPALQRRWRFCGAMMATAATLAVGTLPVVGFETWFDWLDVGKEAAALYQVNQNWVVLSRDLFGLPARVGIDFTLAEQNRRNPVVAGVGWLSWAVVFVGTVAVSVWQSDRRPTGTVAGFVALGAFLTCYRFMYYDVLLSATGVFLLASDWRRWRSGWDGVGVVAAAVALHVVENVLLPTPTEWALPDGHKIGTGYAYPWDTGVVLALWAWTGLRLLLYPRPG